MVKYTNITTIDIEQGTKKFLDRFRECKSESYDDVVRKLLLIAKNPDKANQIVGAIKTMQGVMK